MESPAAKALLQFSKGPTSCVGPDRIRLLESIRELGSISGAAKAVGLSYKGAWDAVQAFNNIFEQPLVISQAGGQKGGKALVTPAGEAVLEAYRRIDAQLCQMVQQLNQAIGEQSIDVRGLLWGLGMRTSARNALRGVVQSVTTGAVNCEVALKVSPSVTIIAIVTKDSVDSLELEPGREAMALIKSSFVILAPGDAKLATSARNRLVGVISRLETGAVNDEIVLDLDNGKSLTATITRGSAEDLGFAVGQKAQALIKASHVILAVD